MENKGIPGLPRDKTKLCPEVRTGVTQKMGEPDLPWGRREL